MPSKNPLEDDDTHTTAAVITTPPPSTGGRHTRSKGPPFTLVPVPQDMARPHVPPPPPAPDGLDDLSVDDGSPPSSRHPRLWQFLRQGGAGNALQLFNCIASQWLQREYSWVEPQPLPRVGLYHPQLANPSLADWQASWQADAPVAALLFYRTQVQAANTGFIDVFCQRLQAQGLNPLPIAVASLKEAACLAQVEDWLDEADARLIINTTAFALSNPEAPSARPFRRDIPVLQAICALDNHEQWQANAQGLGSRDLAMHIVLPELDGRLITQPISFKGLAWRSERSQSDVVCYQPHLPGMDFVAELACNWMALAHKSNAYKRIALILANYPTRDGRIGNGVGLDTPAAALNILKALQQGYPVEELPDSGTALIHQLLGGVTNDLDSLDARPCAQSLALDRGAIRAYGQSGRYPGTKLLWAYSAVSRTGAGCAWRRSASAGAGCQGW